MNFKPVLIQAIVDGHKTETRRIVKPNETISDDGCIVYDKRGRVKWRVGQVYRICPGRGKKGVARIEIVSLKKSPVKAMTVGDALAEGIKRVDLMGRSAYTSGMGDGGFYPFALHAFMSLWNSINKGKGQRWEDNPMVWVVQFRYVGLVLPEPAK